MHIEEHIPLRDLTTLKVGGKARYFCRVKNEDELREAVAWSRSAGVPLAVLGGGSNVLVSDGGFDGLVVKNEIGGIEWKKPKKFSIFNFQFSKEEREIVAVVGAGENWDGFVTATVEKGLWGLENLSGIPGTVGAAPVQNIGAYGAEVKDTIEWVEVCIPEGQTVDRKRLNLADCGFEYRGSVFKKPENRNWIITRVAFRLQKNGQPNLQYKDLKNYFSSPPFQGGDTRGGYVPLLSDIRRAVLDIRSKKFPDLVKCGTAGSFFKNPIIPKEQFDALKKKFPGLPGFPVSERFNLACPRRESEKGLNLVKIPLAWILDNICHLKGFRKCRVALFEKQPIVLVNEGGASAGDVKVFAREVAEKVKEKTGIDIEWEVQQVS